MLRKTKSVILHYTIFTLMLYSSLAYTLLLVLLKNHINLAVTQIRKVTLLLLVLLFSPLPPFFVHIQHAHEEFIRKMIKPLFKLPQNPLISTSAMLETLREVKRFHTPLAELYLAVLPSLNTVKSTR